MTKKSRQDLILKIIAEKEIDNQQDLVDILNNSGYNVTQATISRDINELKLIKVEGITKKYKYTLPFIMTDIAPESIKLLSRLVTAILPTNTFIVVKTRTGGAGTVANIIDNMNFTSVVGSIAGDDTLLVVMNSKNDAEVISFKIKEMIKNAE